MELQEFLEKFLPNYEEQRKAFFESFLENGKKVSIEKTNYAFQQVYFPESLKNFVDKICEKQRENCGKAWGNAPIEDECLFIRNAEQPKIEEL